MRYTNNMKQLSLLFLILFSFPLVAQYEPQSSGEIIEHEYYSLSYNETHEQANWVYYKSRKSM